MREYSKVKSSHKIIEGVDFKQCKKCLEFITADSKHFYKWVGSIDGLADWCKQCRKDHDKSVENKTRTRFINWYEKPENQIRCQNLRRKWKKENPERRKELARQSANRRYARIKGASIITMTDQEWQLRLAEFNNHCAYCLKPFDKLEIEHMIPIARGGTHEITNIVPACRSCNANKHTKTLLEFANECCAF